LTIRPYVVIMSAMIATIYDHHKSDDNDYGMHTQQEYRRA